MGIGIIIIQFADLLFKALFAIVFIRILLTWFPQVNWYNQPFAFLKQVSDPILLPFSAIIPPFGGLDFSPILALFVLDIVRRLVIHLLLIIF